MLWKFCISYQCIWELDQNHLGWIFWVTTVKASYIRFYGIAHVFFYRYSIWSSLEQFYSRYLWHFSNRFYIKLLQASTVEFWALHFRVLQLLGQVISFGIFFISGKSYSKNWSEISIKMLVWGTEIWLLC